MLVTRVIPCLLLKDGGLVKTVKFKNPSYIGDPINTVRIFNELEVDELIFLDITSSINKSPIRFDILSEIANECFMPLTYGGGITNMDDVKKIFTIGIEKVVINSFAYEDSDFISRIADMSGNQSVIASIDVKKNFFGKYELFSHSATKKQSKNLVDWAVELENKGAGEIFITSIDKEGTWMGYDIQLIKQIADAVSIPVIANGGAGNIQHLVQAKKEGNASALSVGSMVVYQKKDFGVLINFPGTEELHKALDV
jgi:cyclase